VKEERLNEKDATENGRVCADELVDRDTIGNVIEKCFCGGLLELTFEPEIIFYKKGNA
jgi:hypothetical protein